MSDRRGSSFKTLLESEVCTLIQAAEDVYQVRFKNRAANAYLVVGSKRTILIDVGLSSTMRTSSLASATSALALTRSTW